MSRSIPKKAGYAAVTTSARSIGRLAGTVLPRKADWFATMEGTGVPMFNDVEEMAEAAGRPAREPILRERARSDILPSGVFHGRKRGKPEESGI